MAIIVNFAGASLRKPGAYSRVRVAQGGASQAQLGVLALIGESTEGDSFANETGLSAVTFNPDQFSKIAEKYGSGELVNAARIALAPSNDPQISGGAQQIILMKTNQSVKAQLAMASSYGTVKAQKAGAPGNNISMQIDNSSGKRIITIANALTGESEISKPIGGQTILTIQVTAGGVTAATMTISSTKLTTVITGSGATALNIPLTQFHTIGQLVDFISSQPGYVASTTSTQKSSPLSAMDRVTTVNVLVAYQLKRDASDVRDFFAGSPLVDFVPTAYLGLPAVAVKTFLSGGALGATSNANIQDCLDGLLKVRTNFVVPLFSRDATADIADSLTDAASGYTILSSHVGLNTHCLQASTIRGRKERQGFAGYKGTYAEAVDASGDLGSARVALMFQNVDVQSAAGSVYTAQPHMLAVLNAAMKCSAVVGLPNTFKLINATGVSVDNADFDPETDADDAINSNLTFVERAPGGGFRFVLDNNTYGQELNAWIYNRPSVVYAADTAAFAIRLNMERFVGQRNSDISPESIKNLLISVLDGLRASGIIVPDASTGGKGFKDLAVSFSGSVISTSVTLALVEGFEFVLNDITVARATG